MNVNYVRLSIVTLLLTQINSYLLVVVVIYNDLKLVVYTKDIEQYVVFVHLTMHKCSLCIYQFIQ